MAKVFSLAGKGLKLNTREDIQLHLKDIDPAALQEIHLNGNTIGVDAAAALGELLQKSTSIKIANFADVFTGRLISEIPQALSSICDALKDKTTLEEINLSDNAFGGRSVDPMVPFLTTNRSFKILRLNNNGLGPAGGETIAHALHESAKISFKEGKQSNLHTVICGRNRLEDGSAPAWADAFAAHKNLVEVKMPQNGIRPDGIAALARGLAHCPNLQQLDLQDNTFSETGSKAFADALPSWKNLRVINFSDCNLADEGEGVSAVITALSKAANLELSRLELQNNNMESASFSLLAQAVGKLPKIKHVELQWNEVEDEDDEGLTTLRDTLKQRGGTLLLNDDDEEEEETNDAEPTKPLGQNVSAAENVTDDLADLMDKVKIQ